MVVRLKKTIHMKSFISHFYIIILIGLFNVRSSGFPVMAGPITSQFKVEGVCSMCKKRIENGALIKGVKKAEWNTETGLITVTYDPEKISLLDIHKAIAEIGHSTDKVKAESSAYDKLPACCQYSDGVDKH